MRKTFVIYAILTNEVVRMTVKILVVDDEQKIREIIRLYLERDGFEVYEAYDGQMAMNLFETINPDLIILDLMLPKLSGEKVGALIRSTSETPIIMLTAKTSEEDRIAGLKSGADDYVSKPFSPKELVARVNAVLRRNWGKEQEELGTKDQIIRINQTRHETVVNGQVLALTPTEHRLLVLFVQNPGVVFSRAQLAEEAFGWEYEGYEDTMYVHIKNLRKKLEKVTEKRYITTVYGMGYRWSE